MNKSLLTLLVTLLAATAAHADVVINATKFPDATFRNYVSTYYDRNGDGVMSNSELAAVTTMDVSGQGINNLVGIEYFTALTSLNCSNNNIQDLTLRELTGLQSLACSNNQLRTLSFYNSVQNLYCAHNNLSGQYSYQNMTNLKRIDVSYNEMTSVGFKNCSNLIYVGCQNNQLAKTIDFTGCTSLKTADIYGNKIPFSEMTKLVNNLPTTTISDAVINAYSSYSGTDENEVSPKQVIAMQNKGWKVREQVAPSSMRTFTGVGVDFDTDNFPDAIFYGYLNGFNAARYDKYISIKELATFTDMDLNSMGISDLKGIEHFTSLTRLLVSGNKLKTLDVSKLTKLQTLSCINNQLTSLNVNGCESLTTLYASNNQLTTLDLTGCNVIGYVECGNNHLSTLKVTDRTKLTQLYCQNNRLKTLSMSGCTSLNTLECQVNELTSLDVKTCTKLKKLDCHQNLLTTFDLPNTLTLTQISCQQNCLKGLGMDAMIASLPDRTGTSTGVLNVRFTYNTSWPEGNIMTVNRVNVARAKNWNPRFYNGGWMSYDGAEEYEQGDVTGDNKVDVEDVNAIINIILKTMQASDYKGDADVTGDNKIDVEDVNAIINIILKLS